MHFLKIKLAKLDEDKNFYNSDKMLFFAQIADFSRHIHKIFIFTLY